MTFNLHQQKDITMKVCDLLCNFGYDHGFVMPIVSPLTFPSGSQTLSTTGGSGPLSVGVPPSLPVTTSQHAGSQDWSHGELCVGMS